MEIDIEDEQIGDKQVCRLCGKSQRLCIDVFGEEGTKRFVGTKIHSKINILIDETDPLPKAICVQCLGKLEFVCDFQEECLRTQQLLRNQYNLPSSSSSSINEEDKSDDSIPSTSNICEQTINKNVSVATSKSIITNNRGNQELINNVDQENINSNHESKTKFISINENSFIKNYKKKTSEVHQSQIKTISKKNGHLLQVIKSSSSLVTLQRPEIATTTRNLRSRQNVEVLNTITSNNSVKDAPVSKKRLRNQTTNADTTLNSSSNSDYLLGTKKKPQIDEHNKIQIATNTLNKVLSAISHAPGVGVSVKESSQRNNDSEDISFTIELSKKQKADSLTVLAKVFPEQNSCLVDKSIVTFLEDETTQEVNNLVNNISTPTDSKDKNQSLIDILQSAEDLSVCTKNPEELFKMDGEEIHVDENIEQLNVNSQLNYQCKLCQKTYERKDKCAVHVKTHLGIKQYICIICQSKFVCKSDVMKHIRCSHTNPRPILCPKCPKRFRSKFDLTEHMNVHKGVKPYQCADCDQSYHHKVSLQMHVKSHMPPQNLACEYCGKIFPYRTRLLSHVGSVHMKDKRNFRCRFCYNLYSSLSVLNDHIKTRHATTYTCEICRKTFKVASKYKTHVLQHSNPKPYTCNVCKNRYASKAFLNEHLLKHAGVRKHVCQTCEASFAQASHLAAHRHVHGEKNYACPKCGKLFNRRDNMKVHQRRHLMFEDKGKSGMNSENEQKGNSGEN